MGKEFAASAAYARTERHLGYSSWVGEHRDRPLLVLRESESWERTRFTVAHELGHLVLHSRASCVVGSEQESEADRFAAELLAPIAAVATELPTMMSLLNLKPLKDKWGLSLGALIRHIRDARLIDPVRAEMLTKQLYSRTNPDTGHTWGDRAGVAGSPARTATTDQQICGALLWSNVVGRVSSPGHHWTATRCPRLDLGDTAYRPVTAHPADPERTDSDSGDAWRR